MMAKAIILQIPNPKLKILRNLKITNSKPLSFRVFNLRNLRPPKAASVKSV